MHNLMRSNCKTAGQKKDEKMMWGSGGELRIGIGLMTAGWSGKSTSERADKRRSESQLTPENSGKQRDYEKEQLSTSIGWQASNTNERSEKIDKGLGKCWLELNDKLAKTKLQ